MTAPWNELAPEEQALLNPAFVGLIGHQVASGFQRESGRGLPFVLAFVAVPVVLHAHTRKSIPGNIRSSMAAWLDAHPEALLGFPERAAALVSHVREGLLFATRHGAASINADGAVMPNPLTRTWASTVRQLPSSEVHECAKSALFVGRWFGLAGTEATIMALWGVRP